MPASAPGETTMTPALIGLDWGTSALRAYLLAADGTVVDGRTAPLGILKVVDAEFEAVFEDVAGPWLGAHGALPVVASGMIGSRQGWVEAPYVACPAGAEDLARGLVTHLTGNGRSVRFVPGLSIADRDGVPDVMRGEETQIVGDLAGRRGDADGVYLLPGTHSKWAAVEGGRITWFATFITGELFAVLCDHSILGRLMRGDGDDRERFRQGLAYAAPDPGGRGGLLRRLFSARTLALFDRLPATGVRSYLSGLLIGAEIHEARVGAEVAGADPGRVTLIGEARLAALYAEALAHQGIAATIAGDGVTARGLAAIAGLAGLTGG
ncbi:MAG: 2-dehydro-3-deoxygalactonokinase [Alphaproteobacteria bacterium]